ncbi:regulator of G- signaling 11 isoform X1, partial [Pelobates cultripes]
VFPFMRRQRHSSPSPAFMLPQGEDTRTDIEGRAMSPAATSQFCFSNNPLALLPENSLPVCPEERHFCSLPGPSSICLEAPPTSALTHPSTNGSERNDLPHGCQVYVADPVIPTLESSRKKSLEQNSQNEEASTAL